MSYYFCNSSCWDLRIFPPFIFNLNFYFGVLMIGYYVMNSYWGEKGYFRLIRGVNSLNIESECSWSVPKDTWT